MRRLYKVVFVLVAALLISTASYSQMLYEQAFKFGKVLEWIQNYYVDSVNVDKMVEDAIVAMLKDLDPHSSYLTKKEVAEMNEPLQGNFEGIGVSFNVLNDTVLIVNPIPGGPSERVGIQAGDRIIKVDGKNIAGVGVTTDQVYSMLRGKKGTMVAVSVLRRRMKGLLDFNIIRDKIPIYSVDACYKVTDDIGYIKINRFALTTMDEFNSALLKLKDQKVKNLILDLSGNGGGYLEVATSLADQFLENGKLIVYTEGINSPKKEYFATHDGNFEKGHLVILIDEGTASASEIVAGAIQDWDRGIIVGRRSFGKGLVQKPMLLPDQSMIRLTVARYYTPTGRLIQKPYNHGKDDYDKDLINRYNNGELAHKDSIHFPDSLKYYTLRNLRPVYGGGGIMPDYFVSIDTSYYSDYYRDLVQEGIISQFVLNYMDANRQNLNKTYPSFEKFKDSFVIGETFLNELNAYAEKQGVKIPDKEIKISENQVKMLLKAYIARDLWTNSEFYQIANDADDKFTSAVNILKNWDLYDAMLLDDKK